MLTKILTRIKIYYKTQKENKELQDAFLLDYRLKKDIMAISKLD